MSGFPMRRVAALVLLILAASSHGARAGEPDVRACDFEVKARCASGDARVKLADGIVQSLEINAVWCGLPGKPGYSCMLDASRGDRESRWSDDGGATLIDLAPTGRPDQPDRAKVTVGRHVSIDLSATSATAHCGAGAALPRAIVIPSTKGKCRVWLDQR